MDGEIFTTVCYETKRDNAIALEDLWNEFKIAQRIISGFSFSVDGNLEFKFTSEREELLKEWISIGRPSPFPLGRNMDRAL